MADISKLSPDGGTTEYNLKDSTARANIGDLSELETTDKSDLVSAINEVAQTTSGVTGVKGSAESNYRTGNVSIAKANIGLGNVENKSASEILHSGYITTGTSGQTRTYATIEGINNTVSDNDGMHVEGANNSASAWYSHAEGDHNTINSAAQSSHVGGTYNISSYTNQFITGKYNRNKSTTSLEIGWGSYNSRKNIFEVYNDGSISQDDGSTKFRFTQNNGVDGYYDASGTFHPFGGGSSGSVTGVKGDSESSYRTGDVNITKANIGLANVENKSSSTIRGELTSSDVTTALGYTPLSKSSNGSVGQFAVSDGQGGVTWLTMTNAEEVQY